MRSKTMYRCVWCLGLLLVFTGLAMAREEAPAQPADGMFLPEGPGDGGGHRDCPTPPVVCSVQARHGMGHRKLAITTARFNRTTGRVDATTRLENKNRVSGFHTTVVIVAVDRQGRELHRSRVHRYGIGARGFGGMRARNIDWSTQVRADVRDRVAGLAIAQVNDDDLRVLNQLANWIRWLTC